MKLTIRKKMLLCVLLPLSILGIIIVFIAVTSLRTSIIHQVESSLKGTASATLAAYDQNSGSYIVANNGDIPKLQIIVFDVNRSVVGSSPTRRVQPAAGGGAWESL